MIIQCIVFLRNLLAVFHSFCTNLHPTNSVVSTALVFHIYLIIATHRYEMISHCGFDWHFPGDLWYWASFLVSVDHLNVFFGKVYIHGYSVPLSFSLFYFIFFCFSGPHLWHMEVPRISLDLEVQLLAYTRATATPDLSHICDPRHSSWQTWTLNPLSEARD